MRGYKRIYIRQEAHAAGRGSSGKSVQACTGWAHGRARATNGQCVNAPRVDGWDKARTCGIMHRYVGLGTDSLYRHKLRVQSRMRFKPRTATAVATHVQARTRIASSKGQNGHWLERAPTWGRYMRLPMGCTGLRAWDYK
jgi:hypothetical protein